MRNSWGTAYGELGFFRIELGKNLLGIEERVAWVTPGSFTVVNYPCNEDGSNCLPEEQTIRFKDPSMNIRSALDRRRLHGG